MADLTSLCALESDYSLFVKLLSNYIDVDIFDIFDVEVFYIDNSLVLVPSCNLSYVMIK